MSEQPKPVGNFFLIVLIAVIFAIVGIFGISALAKRSKEEKRATNTGTISETRFSRPETLPIRSDGSENRIEAATGGAVVKNASSEGSETPPELDRRPPE